MPIITFGGDLGSGKTTVSKKVAAALGYDELCVGRIFKEMALAEGKSIEEFYAEMEENPELERAIDQHQAQLMEERDNLVVQGRVAWYFAKQSPFKSVNFYLAVSPAAGAERQLKRPENAGRTPEQMLLLTKERQKTENERYKMLYGIENHMDKKHYDFVVDTSAIGEEEVFRKVMEHIRTA